MGVLWDSSRDPPRQRGNAYNQTNKMKETLGTLLRHSLTALLAVGTLLAQRGMIAPEDADQVNASGATLRDGLVVVGVAIVSRLAMKYGGKFFRGSHVCDVGKSTGSLLLLVGMAGLVGLGLPSCQSPGGMEPVPLRASYKDGHGNVYAYDTQTGVSVQIIDRASGK
jgi:hypothetical protein